MVIEPRNQVRRAAHQPQSSAASLTFHAQNDAVGIDADLAYRQVANLTKACATLGKHGNQSLIARIVGGINNLVRLLPRQQILVNHELLLLLRNGSIDPTDLFGILSLVVPCVVLLEDDLDVVLGPEAVRAFFVLED